MACTELKWYGEQDEALRRRIRVLARFVADLNCVPMHRILPGACRGARDDREMFDLIVDQILAPFLSERTQRVVRSALDQYAVRKNRSKGCDDLR